MFLSLQYWFPMRTSNNYIKKACLDLKAYEGRQILMFGVRENSGVGCTTSVGQVADSGKKEKKKEGEEEGEQEGEGEKKDRERKGGREGRGKGGPSASYWNTREPTQENNCRSYCSFIVFWKCHSEWQLFFLMGGLLNLIHFWHHCI